jgi:hypothetical protein
MGWQGISIPIPSHGAPYAMENAKLLLLLYKI